jgi:hypothetical protein
MGFNSSKSLRGIISENDRWMTIHQRERRGDMELDQAENCLDRRGNQLIVVRIAEAQYFHEAIFDIMQHIIIYAPFSSIKRKHFDSKNIPSRDSQHHPE